MLKTDAATLIDLGRSLEETAYLFLLADGEDGANVSYDREQVLGQLAKLEDLADKLEMPVSSALCNSSKAGPPETYGEWLIILKTIKIEAKTRSLYALSVQRGAYLDKLDILSDRAQQAFPSAYAELVWAGSCHAFGLDTASVFHTMRAAEMGARALAVALDCTFPHPLDQVDLHPLLEQCDSKINAMKALPKSAEKAANLKFYSEAASQFRYFKDGWRIHVAHGRATYSESQALAILRATTDFFEKLAERLSE